MTLVLIIHGKCKPDQDLRLCILFDFCGWLAEDSCQYTSQLATEVLRNLKMDGNTIRRVSHILKFLREEPENNPEAVRRYFSNVGAECGDDVVALKKVIYGLTNEFFLELEWKTIQANKDCISIRDLALTGADLLALGVEQGKEIGAYLNAALDEVLREPKNNTKEYLTEYIRQKIREDFIE